MSLNDFKKIATKPNGELDFSDVDMEKIAQYVKDAAKEFAEPGKEVKVNGLTITVTVEDSLAVDFSIQNYTEEEYPDHHELCVESGEALYKEIMVIKEISKEVREK